jgi:hypothetical protein
MVVDFKMPSFNSSLTIDLVDPESGQLTLKAFGNLLIKNLEIGANSRLDKSLIGLLRSFRSDKAQTKEDVIEALKAHVKCDTIEAGLTVNTFASEGARGRDLGKDEFGVNLVAKDLSIEKSGAELSETSGVIGSLDARLDRRGGKKDAKASLHVHGAFTDIPSMTSLLSTLDVNVSGLHDVKVYGIRVVNINSTASKVVKKGIAKEEASAQEEGPDRAMTDAVFEAIQTNSGSINAQGIVDAIGGDITKEQVKDCCIWLIKNKKIEVSNPKWAKLPRKKKEYKPSKSTGEKLDSKGKKTSQVGSMLGSSRIKSSGLDVNASGRSQSAPGQTEGSLEASAHVDKELVSKAYKMLELAQTVFKVI